MPNETYFARILGLIDASGRLFAVVKLRFSTGGYVDHDAIRYGLARENAFVELGAWRCNISTRLSHMDRGISAFGSVIILR